MRVSVVGNPVIWLAFVAFLPIGCQKVPKSPSPIIASSSYQERPALEGSLFPSDQAVLGDEAIARILSSKLILPPKSRLAVMQFSHDGHYYWSQEAVAKAQEEFAQTLTTTLLASKRIAEVTPLPSLMIPKQPSIPLLREAAVRMQADLLLVYRMATDVYSREAVFSKDKAKAFSSCEAVLLDIRTGLVPFTRIITRERLTQKQPNDLVFNETIRRAEQDAGLDSLKALAEEMVAFLNSVAQ